MYDAVVIGGGFYGATIAIYLKKQRGFANVLLIEREHGLLLRASYNNQARVHNGYHYPRSFTTAFRSRVNFPRFVRDFPEAMSSNFTKLYAIAKRNSKVTATQFERFCFQIGARLEVAPPGLRDMFEKRLVENVYITEEYAFDATRLAQWARDELQESGVEVRLDTRVVGVARKTNGLSVQCDAGTSRSVDTRYLFNCTYSGLNQLGGDFPASESALKHEISEMCLMKMPPELENIGITVMDGPFFSSMPFPGRGLHTLSHVRYTPHCNWIDSNGNDPYEFLANYHRETRGDRMVRDAMRYLPAIAEASYVDSLFEVKTVLVKNEGDDGRPILFERHASLLNCYSILGGKIDNIYDILEKLDAEHFDVA